jgi:hypothetical protein
LIHHIVIFFEKILIFLGIIQLSRNNNTVLTNAVFGLAISMIVTPLWSSSMSSVRLTPIVAVATLLAGCRAVAMPSVARTADQE